MKLSFEFNNRFFNELPGDIDKSVVPRQVYNACYSQVTPRYASNPKLLAYSKELAEQLNLSSSQLISKEFAEVFVGNQLVKGMAPYAMCYGGHQFGNWAGQLGDGRAINLAEIIDSSGQNQTLQLKGAGLTQYSRAADGLAVLRSSVREFLCSEAMHYLGVPTTRALSLILTGDEVMRDMFYDGNPALELGAVVCRVAPSFLRVGNFQIFAARKELDILRQLMEFCIKYDFPHLGEPCTETYEQWFDEICQSTAKLTVHWMRVGFVHGVMNTDNMSILGLTIDYGPYGWLENYDPMWTPNTTDAQGKRYCYGNQPQIAQWNLYQLANAIATVVGRTQALEKSLHEFAESYTQLSQKMYADKLGIKKFNAESDQKLITALFDIFSQSEVDMTIFFRQLGAIELSNRPQEQELIELVEPSFYQPKEFKDELLMKLLNWFRDYMTRIGEQGVDDRTRQAKMNEVNPKYVLRNYLAQQAIDKATNGDSSEINHLLQLLRYPYDEQSENEKYSAKRPEWARHKAGCSMLSCSS